MSELFYAWAQRWNVPFVAISELINSLVVSGESSGYNNEREVAASVRLEASRKNVLLWRNNVGVLNNEQNVPIRYGLANESARINKQLKSSDLIGIRPNGQFIARETKRPGWKYTGTEREIAQLNFILLINAHGGDACFTDGTGSI